MRLVFLLALLLGAHFLQAQATAPTHVNSAYDEQNPVLSPDGRTLYFTIGNHPENIGGKRDPGDIWFSRLIGNEWSAPIHAGSLLNNRSYNAVIGFTADDKLFLHGHYDPSGNTARTQGIAVAAASAGGWSQPVNIQIPYYQNKSAILSGAISHDGLVFLFSAETYGSYGVDDLYVTFRKDGKWSEPKSLGPAINTQFQEMSPSLGADGKTIYFSSNGRKGKGSFDVYSAQRLDDTWMNWTSPVNLGDNINSEGRDLFFRMREDLSLGIFTSTVNSDGYGDIKLYSPVLPPVMSDTVITTVSSADTTVRITETVHPVVPGQSPAVKVNGIITNNKTGEPIAATVTFSAPSMDAFSTTATTDGYTVAIPSTGEYTIAIEAPGFVSAMEKLNINTFEMTALEMDFALQPVEVGTTVSLKNVLFAQAKTDILPESFPELDLVVNFLKTNPAVRIELSGHTDNRGRHADNVRLSQQRVNKVRAYLVSKGIDGNRITGKGYGGTKPIASNDSEESRRMNRRVEFIIKRS